jgi:redox-sensitive bicupin YhaK (pirin superfamily)
MLDEFSSKAPAGFPDHPHRGFETVTYMMSGHFRYIDDISLLIINLSISYKFFFFINV